ncbi:MAG: 50S ribosomal protein L11 methyltransferase [Deltaproteobacteria bacterium]|nr:50S ribosomal protein L11 methyltransferase [Deltaproteobacteria bacterium]
MRVGIVHTRSSPCRCAQSIARGLETLGHESVLVDSEEIELQAAEMSRRCDLIIDHTDTFHERGLLRPLVRQRLESRGARIVGSDSKACFLADDKAAAKARLAEAGIPVPPGIVVTGKDWEIPTWLGFPVILKPACEHMSRGLVLADSKAKAFEAAADLLHRYGQPVLVEQYIPGRELAVSLLERLDGIQVLPPLEWFPGDSESGILSEPFKLKDPPAERQDAGEAKLSAALKEELEALSIRAFHVLGLRDYARFDIRLSPGGTFFFMEANTTPSLEFHEAIALSAGWSGMDYPALVEAILSAARRRYSDDGTSKSSEGLRIDLPCGTIELVVPKGVHHPPTSTVDLAGILDVKPGESVLDLGCGSGFLAIAAAKLGAGHVTATDLNPQALDAASQNGRMNHVGERISIHAGSWYEALPVSKRGRFHLIVATPPQTPGPYPFGPRYGGFDGTRHLFSIIDAAPDHLERDGGRLWILAISLANPSALIRRLEERFSEISVVRETVRPFTPDEYEKIEKGLFGHFLSLRSSSRAEFTDAGEGRYSFRNLFIRASGVRNL